MNGVLNNRGDSTLRQHLSQLSRPDNGHARKRQRKRKACDTCRHRKIKCEVTTKSKCSFCSKANIPCSLVDYRRQRQLKKYDTTADINYNIQNMVDRLETNIQRMEAHFQKIGLDLGEDVNGSSFFDGLQQSDESSSSSPAGNADSITDTGIWNSEPIHLDAEQDLSATMQNVYHTMVDPASDEADPVIPKDLPCFYVPRCFTDTPNAGFSTLSSEGTEWITHKMEGASVDNLQSFLSLGRHRGSNRGPLEGLFSDKHFSPLPPKDEIILLVNDYLQQFNSLCPIFQQSSLLSLCEENNLQGLINFPGRWASLNVVLAIGYMMRIKNTSIVQTDRQKSWLSMKNALGVLNELCFGLPDLWSIQALIGMIFFLLGTLSYQPCGYLISCVMRICHVIRLERSENGSVWSPEELEQRRRVFWLAYSLDKEISLRVGIPLSQRDDDMDVLLPMEVPLDNIGIMPTTNQQGTFNTFRSMCELSVIKSQVYKHLYSVTAADRPLVEVAAAVAMLNEKLQQWKDSIPVEFQPESRRLSGFPKSALAVTLFYLHLSYFNCLIAIHRITAVQGSRLGRDLIERNSVYNPPHPVVFMSESLCTNAATASINLLKYMPQSNITLIGIMIYYPILASQTLSSTIVQNPRDTSRIYHIQLIMQVETFVSSLVLDTPNEGVDGLLKDCAEYRSVAEAAVREATQICRV
ncbi:hypothetical protein N7449_007315 [Penicillium cf. viridicatum]|uniref:Zn(2)-C6 fungal-type domain-containing protein n=1 Tax=Penicillium cf. viridicatum TaxID=2972119 RepID=A0A9W9JIU1_9EURO|nr:hypothetical protein N7449_007315 [Penicillium cf. viridicatum]